MITCHVKYVIDPYSRATELKFILSYERSFMRPLLE